jgi:Zn-dependent protease with chaperone function
MNQFLVYGLLLLTFQQQEPPSYNIFSLEQDVEIGLESAKEADRNLPLVRDASVNEFLREIGARLARNSPAPTLRYRFRIVNSREGDAVTFPGGAIYIDRQLIELAGDEQELAAILAHEIAHAAARHGTAQLSRQLLILSPASILAGFLTRDGWKEQLGHMGISFGTRASFLGYSSSQEIEANAIAVQMLTKSGYSPYALSTFREKVNSLRAEKSGLLAYAYHHPQGEQAADHLDGELGEVKTPQRPLRPSPVFRTFKATLAKLPLPSPNTTSSAALANLYVHPELYYRLGYPDGWAVTQRGPNGGIIAPPGGIQSVVIDKLPSLTGASRTVENVRTGVIFDLFDIDHPMPLEQATERLIVYLNQNNQSPRDSSAWYRVVPGAHLQILMGAEPALRTVMIGRPPSSAQPTEIVWLVTRLYYQTLFYVLCVAPEGEEFDKFQPVFEQIIRSIELRER